MDAKKRTISFYAAGAAVAYDYDVLKQAAARDDVSISKKIARGIELAALEEKLGIQLSYGAMFALGSDHLKDLCRVPLNGNKSLIVMDEDAYMEDRELSNAVRSWSSRGREGGTKNVQSV